MKNVVGFRVQTYRIPFLETKLYYIEYMYTDIDIYIVIYLQSAVIKLDDLINRSLIYNLVVKILILKIYQLNLDISFTFKYYVRETFLD